MDELIDKAIYIFELESRGLPMPEEARDTIAWLIRRKVEAAGMDEADRYIRDGLWKDYIRMRDNEAD